MNAGQFMPSDEVVAGIKADLLRYETERAKAQFAVRWRVPLFLGIYLLLILVAALVFNRFSDVNEQWFSPPHVFLYVIGFVVSFFIYGWAMKPATNLQQAFRAKALPTIFSFINGVTYSQGRTPGSFDRLPRETLDTFNR